ncbi:hypothetical protein CsSME_00019014 [Camellia sinensis var. sinensis]
MDSSFLGDPHPISPHRRPASHAIASSTATSSATAGSSQNDLHQLFQQFGVVTKVVMLRAKNQALLQMQDIPSAVNALQFYTNVQPSIRGMNVYVPFSSHQELTTMDQNSQGRGDEEIQWTNSTFNGESL